MVQVMARLGLVDRYWSLVVVDPTFLVPLTAGAVEG